MSDHIHCMVDLETLDTRTTAVVLSAAFVPFSMPQGGVLALGGPISQSFQVNDQLLLGRTIDSKTLEWWKNQDSGAQKKAFSGYASASDFFQKTLPYWLGGHPKLKFFWCKGPSFDAAIIDSFYSMWNFPCPIRYNQWRDVRTVGDDVERPKFEGTPHDPIDDCVYQIRQVANYCNSCFCPPSWRGEKQVEEKPF